MLKIESTSVQKLCVCVCVWNGAWTQTEQVVGKKQQTLIAKVP